ncbi:MAG: Gldg family protein, partial [Planctomycetota bacterium]
DTNDINDVDILLVIHPKGLSEPTLFAIDQFVLAGGRTIVCVDPHCFMDRPPQGMQMQMQMQHSSSSELNQLLRTWGLEMPESTFAGDRNLALKAAMRANQRPDTIIGFLGLNPEGNCFSKDHVVTAELNQVRFLFSGILNEVTDSNDANDVSDAIERTPLITTSSRGNTFTISGPYELMFTN